MPGNFNPSPITTGAERGHIEEILLDGLLEADGTALAKDVNSVVWAERNAEARALAYLWHLSQRFANQADPDRLTDFLARWERILGLRPTAADTETSRRAKVRAKRALDGQPASRGVVNDLMLTVLGDVYAGIVNTTSAEALGYVPGGATVAGGATLGDGAWYSTIAHVVILVTQPAGWPDDAFYEAVGQIGQYLDGLLPAWDSWDWIRDGVGGAGFYLDDDHNLDNERFDI